MSPHPLLHAITRAIGTTPMRLCVGLSGGSDSVALLHAMHSLGHECHALHCNFHLRGPESDRDERFCVDLCRQLRIPLRIEQCDVAGRKASTSGQSVEMIARDMRYAAFEQYRTAHRLDYIAVAHHREDNVETFFLNLLRSSGVKGLAGMAVRSENHLLRPMLNAPKELILDYIEANGLGYVDDSSNASDDYKRNRIRHHILPMLANLFPGSIEAIANSMEVLRQQSITLDADTLRLNATYLKADGSIDVASISAHEASPTDALYRMIHPQGVTTQMVRDIMADVGITGRRFGNYELRHGFLRPAPTAPTLPELTFETITIKSPSDLRCSRSQIILDAESVDVAQLRLGTTCEGLRFDPFGMQGSKLVSDLLCEADIPMAQRPDFPILYHGDIPIWVVGVRASRHFGIPDGATYPRQALLITASRD